MLIIANLFLQLHRPIINYCICPNSDVKISLIACGGQHLGDEVVGQRVSSTAGSGSSGIALALIYNGIAIKAQTTAIRASS